MIFGIPVELKDKETRVGLSPRYAGRLVEKGHTVYIQKGVGVPGGMPDEEYEAYGVQVIDTAEELYKSCDAIIRFKEMQPGDLEMPFQEGQIVFSAFHLGEGKVEEKDTKVLTEKKIIGVAFELTRYADGSRAYTRPMGEIAGRMAPLLGWQYIQRQYGGSGVCMVPISGTKMGKYVILGGGHAGLAAAQTIAGLGAKCVLFEKIPSRMEYLRNVLGTSVELRYSNAQSIAEELKDCDVLINAIYGMPELEIPVVTKEMVAAMPKGSVIVDMEGCGIIETTGPDSTISDPYYIIDDIIYVAVPNIPAMVPRAANEIWSDYIFPMIEDVADNGIKEAAKHNPILRSGIIMVKGQITSKEVADSQGVEYVPLDIDAML